MISTNVPWVTIDKINSTGMEFKHVELVILFYSHANGNVSVIYQLDLPNHSGVQILIIPTGQIPPVCYILRLGGVVLSSR